MKKIFIFVGIIFSLAIYSQGVLTNGSVAPNLTARNPFLDASTSFDTSTSGSNDLGKGLVFPRTDLTQPTCQFR